MFLISQIVGNAFNNIAIAGRVSCITLIALMSYEIFRNRPAKLESANQIMIASASREQILTDEIVRLNALLDFQDARVEGLEEELYIQQNMWLNITIYSNASLIGIFMITLALLNII
jgi:hypothetical protein